MSKDFSPTEAVAIGRIIEARHREKVAALRPEWSRKAAAVRDGTIDPLNQQVDAPGRIGETREVAASAVGMSESRYRQAKKVIAAAEADPDTFGDLPAQMDGAA